MTRSKAIVLCLVLVVAAIAPQGGAETMTNLAACAQRWGALMVDHWLVVDVSHQIDRAAFYRRELGSSPVTGLAQLDQAIARTEEQLQRAREFYGRIYRSKADSDLPTLTALLNEVSSAESENERAADRLLQRLGEQLNQGPFKSTVVSRQQLEPVWNERALIGKDRRPKRILFGSTAAPRDDRVLPLRFDFGKGMFPFFVPMKAPGTLDVASNVLTRTSRDYLWMKRHGVGYHYWAGVYNNQNTYIAPWFLKQHGNQDDVWMKLANGKVLRPHGDWGQVNIWNPFVRDYIRDYCRAQARALRNDPFLLGYDYTAEPHPWGSQPADPPGLPQYSGYNESAIAAFREFLRKKFGSIGALNRAWHTDHATFGEIQPPPDPYMSPPRRATPLSYEFERFRCKSNTRFWRLAYKAYRKFDRRKPVIANAGAYMNGWPVEGLDAWQLQKAGVADWVDMHMNNFWPNLPEQIYLYSLCRLTGKVPVEFEYIWTFPRAEAFDDRSESDFRATCDASVWRNLVWGKQILVFFDVAHDWPTYHNAFLDRDLGYSILRPSICVLPAMKRKALRFSDLLLNTKVSSPPIIVLQPSASIWNSPAAHPNRSFSYHTTVAGRKVHPLLFSQNYPFLYVPEEAVLHDGYSLKSHRVIILPEAPYLPAKMTDRLLAWVRRGGTLITFGPAGLWNPYGDKDGRLMKNVFGKCEVKDQHPGHWDWSWNLISPDSRIETFRDDGGKLLAARAPYGKGNVLVSTSDYDAPKLKRLFYETLDRAIGQRPALCVGNSFELVLREDSRHHQYLFVLNPHIRKQQEDRIVVAGRYPACVDLGVGSGVPVPVRVAKDETQFKLRLCPGEETVVALRAKPSD